MEIIGIWGNKGKIEIGENTVIKGSKYGVYLSAGNSCSVIDASITGSTYGIYSVSTGTLTIGDAEDPLDTTSPVISGGTYGIYSTSTGTVTFNNGVIKGTNSTPYSVAGTLTTRSNHHIDVSYNSSEQKYNAILVEGSEYTITYNTNMNFPEYASTSGFTITEQTETDGDYYNATFTKTSGTTSSYNYIRFPNYDFELGATYQIRMKVRVNSVSNAETHIRHSAVEGDDWTTGRKTATISNSTIGEWTEYTLTRTFDSETYTNTSDVTYTGTLVYTTNPLIEIYTEDLLITDTITSRSISFDFKDVYVGKITTETKISGTTLGTLSTETRTGYLFNGWYTAPTGGTKIETTTVVPAEDTTYYAQWTDVSISLPDGLDPWIQNGSTRWETKSSSDVTLQLSTNASDVTWASSNTEVATVDSNGLVSSVAPGIVEISISDSNNNVLNTIEVYVYNLALKSGDSYHTNDATCGITDGKSSTGLNKVIAKQSGTSALIGYSQDWDVLVEYWSTNHTDENHTELEYTIYYPNMLNSAGSNSKYFYYDGITVYPK